MHAPRLDLPSGDGHRPAADGVRTEDRPTELRAARPLRADQVDDLPLPRGEADVLQHIAAAEVADLENGLHLHGAPPVDVTVDIPPHHHPDDAFVVRRRSVHRADEQAVLQHRDAVPDLEDLLQAVGDVEDGEGPFLAHRLQVPEKEVFLLDGQGGSGLVEDEEIGLQVQGPQDLDHRLLGQAQSAHDLVRLPLDVEYAQQLAGLLVHIPDVQEPVARLGGGPQEDVLGHGHVGADRDLLENRGDLPQLGSLRRLEAHRAAVQHDVTFVRAEHPAADVDQGGLASAVFAHQGVDLTLPDGEGDPREGLYAGEALGDPVELDEVLAHGFPYAFSRRSQMSAITPTRVTPPMEASCEYAGTDISTMPFLTTPMMAAPMNVPRMVPRLPYR